MSITVTANEDGKLQKYHGPPRAHITRWKEDTPKVLIGKEKRNQVLIKWETRERRWEPNTKNIPDGHRYFLAEYARDT